MFADEHYGALGTMDMDQGQQASMPEDEDDRRTPLPEARHVVLARALDTERAKKSPQDISAREAHNGWPGLSQGRPPQFSRRSAANSATRADAPGLA